MNGIVVPEQYKKQIRRERNSREYNEAIIRDYVKARPNVVISNEMFTQALDGLTTAGAIVARLVKERRLERRRVKNGRKGHQFTYVWHDTPRPIPERRIIQSNGEVKTRPRTIYATEYELKRINQFFMDYADTEVTAEELFNANMFRKFVHGKVNDKPETAEQKDGDETEDDTEE